MSKKCGAYSESKLGLEPPNNRKSFYAGWEAALEAAPAQQAEPVQEPVAWLAPRIVDSYSRPDLGYETCSKSDYGAFPAYTAPPQRPTEPVQEPAFHGFMSDDGTQVDVCFSPSAPRKDGTYATAYYTSPPRRTMVPLTEKEILAAVGWERAAMYMKLAPNFPVDEAKKETLTNARAVEKAVWEKNHGQA